MSLVLCVAALATGRAPGTATAPASSASQPEYIEPRGYERAVTEARRLLAATEAASGPSSLETARALDRLAGRLGLAGMTRGTEARDLEERALRIKERQLGPDHPEVADSLDLLASLLAEIRAPNALALLERSLAIRSRALGRDHPDTARSCHLLAKQYLDMDEYAKAEPYVERALEIRERSLGPDHPETIRTQVLRARVLAHAWKDPREILDRALKRTEERAGPDDSEVAEILRVEAERLLRFGGDGDREGCLARALAIDEATFGPDHPRIAWTLLARRSREDLVRARGILERAYGKDDVRLAPVLASLGSDAQMDGDELARIFDRAASMTASAYGAESRRLARQWAASSLTYLSRVDPVRARADIGRALGIYERAPSEMPSELAHALDLLAQAREDLDGFPAALRTIDRALEVLERFAPADTGGRFHALFTRAEILVGMGRYADAETAYLRSIELGEKMPGGPWLAVFESLAEMYVKTGKFDAARRLLDHALETAERSGQGGCARAWILRRLCTLERETGAFDLALEACERAVSLVEACDNPHWTRRFELEAAQLDLARGKPAEALARAIEIENGYRLQFLATARLASDDEALTYAATRYTGLNIALSALADTRGVPLPAGASGKVWDAVVRSRGMVLDEEASRQRILLANASPGERRLVDRLKDARERLSRAALQEESSAIEQARAELTSAERELAQKSSDDPRQRDRRRIGGDDVRRALPAGSVLVSFVKYSRFVPPERVPSYLAFVLRAGAERPVERRLGAAEEIDRLVAQWQREVAAAPPMVGAAAEQAEADYRRAGQDLRVRIWDPIAPLVEGATLVLIVPDGALNLVSFPTLPSASGGYLVEDASVLHEIASERNVVTGAETSVKGHGLLVMGGADFDRLPAVADERGILDSLGSRNGSAGNAYRSPTPTCDGFRSIRFDALPRSITEATEVADSWSSVAPRGDEGLVAELTGSRASEAAFKELAPGREVVHLATHAIQLGESCAVRDGASREEAGDPALAFGALALAGANRREEAGPEEEDGILTSDEVLSLDLRGVAWIVISACESGKGVIAANEGVLGLRRAFQIAGAHTLVSSLWRVRDEESRQWMAQLYAARARGQDTASSVRSAARTVLETRRRSGLSTHPFSWGAYVAVGDWR